ncbi:MAG TPA: hypothetical protein VEP73_06410 [Actinomycetota bacterium]|nr:hypothetical protein [Actinomycetota bacterium]
MQPVAVRSTGLAAPVRAVALGVVTGSRQQLAIALLAGAASRGRFDPGAGRVAERLRSPGATAVAALAAAAELVADKLPFTPARTAPGPMLGRVATGGLVGASVLRDAHGSAALGAALGALGAAGGAVAGNRARVALARRTRVPDLVWGVVEDLVALGLGTLAVASLPGR